MELSRVIHGPVTTEKSVRLQELRTYVLKVDPQSTKVDVKNALKKFYDVEVTSVRVMRVRAKTRAIGAGKSLTKRHASKRMIVTLSPKSKALDIAAFKAS